MSDFQTNQSSSKFFPQSFILRFNQINVTPDGLNWWKYNKSLMAVYVWVKLIISLFLYHYSSWLNKKFKWTVFPVSEQWYWKTSGTRRAWTLGQWSSRSIWSCLATKCHLNKCCWKPRPNMKITEQKYLGLFMKLHHGQKCGDVIND